MGNQQEPATRPTSSIGQPNWWEAQAIAYMDQCDRDIKALEKRCDDATRSMLNECEIEGKAARRITEQAKTIERLREALRSAGATLCGIADSHECPLPILVVAGCTKDRIDDALKEVRR